MKYLPILALLASPAVAHQGAHVHPHDGASWLAVLGSFAVVATAMRLAGAKARK